MEAGAPTPSFTPDIIDYARLQISLEKERKTQRDKARERERDVETKGNGERETVLKRSCHLCAIADSEPSPHVSLSRQWS